MPEADEPDYVFKFNELAEGNRELFRILPDGEIKFGPAFTTNDEMSLRFWDAIITALPQWFERYLKEQKNARS